MKRIVNCVCGNVEMETTGEPILTAVCHCSDCHEGSRKLEALSKATPILDSYGGTAHALYRKDRVTFTKGKELLKNLKVDPDSPNRSYASCCNSYLFLDAGQKMHIIPIFRNRFKSEVPNIEFRMNIKLGPGEKNSPSDVPCFSSFPFQFIKKLIASKFAMIFKY